MKTMDYLYRLADGCWMLYSYAGDVELLGPEIFAFLIEVYGIVFEKLLTSLANGLLLLDDPHLVGSLAAALHEGKIS